MHISASRKQIQSVFPIAFGLMLTSQQRPSKPISITSVFLRVKSCTILALMGHRIEVVFIHTHTAIPSLTVGSQSTGLRLFCCKSNYRRHQTILVISFDLGPVLWLCLTYKQRIDAYGRRDFCAYVTIAQVHKERLPCPFRHQQCPSRHELASFGQTGGGD